MELETLVKFIQEVAHDVGYTGATVIVIALLVLRNQSKMVQALIDSNNLAARQRSAESQQDATLLNTVLTRQNTVLDNMREGLGHILMGFERFGTMINVNSVKQDDLLDEFRTHESAALHRHESSIKIIRDLPTKFKNETEKVVSDAHQTTRQGINHIGENTASMVNKVQGIGTTMANLMEQNRREFEELRKLIQSGFDEIKQELAKLAQSDNEAIQKATKSIEIKLESIESLVKENGNDLSTTTTTSPD